MGRGATDDPVGDTAERDLLLAARTDPEAFGRLYLRTVDAITAYHYARTYCPHTAADLAAETFARAFRDLRRYRPELGTPLMWLHGIAGHLLVDYLRRQKVSTKARERLRMSTAVSVAADLERIETLVDIRRAGDAFDAALAALTPKVRQAVELRVVDELEYDEISGRLACSEGAVRVRVSRGLQQIAVRFEELR